MNLIENLINSSFLSPSLILSLSVSSLFLFIYRAISGRDGVGGEIGVEIRSRQSGAPLLALVCFSSDILGGKWNGRSGSYWSIRNIRSIRSGGNGSNNRSNGSSGGDWSSNRIRSRRGSNSRGFCKLHTFLSVKVFS